MSLTPFLELFRCIGFFRVGSSGDSCASRHLIAISVYDHYSQYMILSPAFASCIYFLSLDNECPEAGERDSNSPVPYLVQDYIYEQPLGSQESTHSKRTLSLNHKQRMLALRPQARSRGYVVRQNVLLVYMVFALTQNIAWNQMYVEVT